MRREERVTVQGPVKKQQPDGVSHRGCLAHQQGACVFHVPASPGGFHCPSSPPIPFLLPHPVRSPGNYMPVTGAAECRPCEPRYACESAGQEDSFVTPCAAGHYCPLGTSLSTQFPCPAGYYTDRQDLFREEDCEVCYCAVHAPDRQRQRQRHIERASERERERERGREGERGRGREGERESVVH